MKIYTRTGDAGETSLYGGRKVLKHDARVEAYGTVDELNAVLGIVLALDADGDLGTGPLADVQADLFTIGSELAAADPEKARARGNIPELPAARVDDLEAWIDRLDAELPALDAFILPGGTAAGAHLHFARTVCRRAERATSALLEARPGLTSSILPYLNRLSDLLFTLARSVNEKGGATEAPWEPMRRRHSRGHEDG